MQWYKPPVNTAPDDELAEHVVHDRLVVLADEVVLHDSRIRRREPGGVHGMRVALRRIRSLLATFGPLYDDAVVSDRREDLAWVSNELSVARDTEVVRMRLLDLAAGSDERELAAAVLQELVDAEAEGVQGSLAAMDSDRYSQVLRDLTAFVTDPPCTGEPATDAVLRKRVRREWRRLRRRARAASETDEGGAREVALHEVRKAAKRLRYAAETLVPSYGEDAARLSRRARRVQRHLGKVQDSAVTQRILRELAERPDRTTSEVFLLGHPP